MFPSNASKKQSQFLNTDTVPSGAYFGLWDNSANYRISFANLLTALGATGTLSQLGDGGQPLLYQAGADNYIRNLKAGFGVTLTQEATEEVTVAVGFTFDETGAALVDDPSSPTPVFRSLVAGSGVSIAEAAGTIQISTGSPVPTNSIVIAQMSDFPAASGGVRTLADNTDYLIVADLVTGDRFVLGDRTSITGSSQFNSSIEYTGSGDMFTWSEASVVFRTITLTANSGTLFNGANTTAATYSVIGDNCSFFGLNMGSVDDVIGVRFTSCGFFLASSGFTFSGDIGYSLFDACFLQQSLGTAVDLASCTFSGFSIINSVAIGGDPSVIFVDGLPNSGNVNPGGIGTLVNNRSGGAGMALSPNISPNDSLWQFSLNDTIQDTRPDSLMSVVGNALVTTISAAGTPTVINAVFANDRASQFTNSAAGVATYNGGKPATVPITFAATVRTSSGGSKSLRVSIAVNGTPVLASAATGTASASSPTRITALWQVALNQGDTVSARVSNMTDTTGVVVQDAVLRVN